MHSTTRNHHLPRLALALFALLVLTGTAGAESTAETTPSDNPTATSEVADAPMAENGENGTATGDTAVATNAMRVVRDPETGMLRPPTKGERVALSPAMQNAVSRSSIGLTEVRHPDGTVTLDLAGRFRTLTIVRKNDDGSLSMDCAASHDHAVHQLETPAAADTTVREEQ